MEEYGEMSVLYMQAMPSGLTELPSFVLDSLSNAGGATVLMETRLAWRDKLRH